MRKTGNWTQGKSKHQLDDWLIDMDPNYHHFYQKTRIVIALLILKAGRALYLFVLLMQILLLMKNIRWNLSISAF